MEMRAFVGLAEKNVPFSTELVALNCADRCERLEASVHRPTSPYCTTVDAGLVPW